MLEISVMTNSEMTAMTHWVTVNTSVVEFLATSFMEMRIRTLSPLWFPRTEVISPIKL